MRPFTFAHVVLSATAVVLLFAAPWHDVTEVDLFPCLAPDCHGRSPPGPTTTCLGSSHFSVPEAALVIGAFTLGSAVVVLALRRRPGAWPVLLSLSGAVLIGAAGFYTLVSSSLVHLFSRQTSRVGETAFVAASSSLVALSIGLAIAHAVHARRSRRT